MSNTTDSIEAGLRRIVLEHVGQSPDARGKLARGLAVPETSVDKMLGHNSWDLALAISAADLLGVDVYVSHGQ